MSNKKDKERWKKIQDNKKKCCINCSQLIKYKDGNYLCGHLTSKGQSTGAYTLINAPDIDKVHAICFDKYNGLNV